MDFGDWLSSLFGGGGQSLPPNYLLLQHRLMFHRHPLYANINGIPVQIIVSQGSFAPAAPPKGPDFTTWTISLGPDIGLTAHITVDRYGHVYVGGGAQFGKSPALIGLSRAEGYLHPVTGRPATPMELQNFQTGNSIDCSVGLIIGRDISYTVYTPLTGQYGVSKGVFSPQAGCAASYSVEWR